MVCQLDPDSIVLDFFSGSATTAHAVMQLNAEDGGHRKFIMVQLPEKTNEKSEAYKAGYKNICEIGKERIRRAGKLLSSRVEAEEKSSSADGGAGTLFYAGSSAKKSACSSGLDVGFRVLKLDSSCMTDVYYHPDKAAPNTLKSTIDNIKDDRTPEDLLFQVMLEKGIVLSCPIEVEQIAGKRVFSVDGGFLIACFDRNVTNQTIVEIAKRRPKIAVFRYSSLDDDPIFVNIEVLFQRYSKDTRRYIL